MCAFACLSCPIIAQTPTFLSGPLPIPSDFGSSPYGTIHANPLGQRTDLLLGQNSRGPYRTSWKNVLPYSERVVLNGNNLLRDLDYTYDESTGTAMFNLPVASRDVLQITYRIDNVGAELNPSLPTAPLQWNLFQGANSRLQFLVRPEALMSDRPFDSSYLQFTNNTRLSKTSSFEAGVFYDLHGGNFAKRGGVRFVNQNKLSIGTVGVSYMRGGQDFSQQDMTHIATGKEIWEANGDFQLSKSLKFNSLFRYTTLLPSTDNPTLPGTTTQEVVNGFEQQLPNKKGTAIVKRSEIQTTAPDGSKTTVVNDSAKIEGILGKNVQANVGFEANTETNSTTPDKNYTQTTSIGVKSRPSKNLLLSGDYRTQRSKQGATDITGVQVETNPFKRWKDLKLRANIENRMQPDGMTLNQDYMLDLPALHIARAQFSGGLRYSMNPSGEKRVGVLSGVLRPASFLELNGTSLFREALDNANRLDPAYQDGYQVEAKLKPVRGLSVSGLLGHNPDNSGDLYSMRALNSRKLGLETQVGSLTLKGQYGIEDEYILPRLARTADFALTMKLSPFDMLSTGFQNRSLFDGGLNYSETWLLSYTRSLNSSLRFTLRGTMTLFEQNRIPLLDKTEYRAEAQVGIRF